MPGSIGSAASMRSRRPARSPASHSAENTHGPPARGRASSPSSDVAERRHENRRVNGRRDLPALHERQARLVAMPGWRRVEDGPAADRRLAAQDDSVASSRDDRRRKAKLSPALPDAHDPRRHARCPDVGVETRAVGDRLELVERDVEPERDRVRVGGDERLAARDLAALDTRQADGDALPRFRPWDVAVVYLDAANAHGHARRLDPELVSRADRARPERPGDDRPDAAQREGPVHPEPRRRDRRAHPRRRLRRDR